MERINGIAPTTFGGCLSVRAVAVGAAAAPTVSAQSEHPNETLELLLAAAEAGAPS